MPARLLEPSDLRLAGDSCSVLRQKLAPLADRPFDPDILRWPGIEPISLLSTFTRTMTRIARLMDAAAKRIETALARKRKPNAQAIKDLQDAADRLKQEAQAAAERFPAESEARPVAQAGQEGQGAKRPVAAGGAEPYDPDAYMTVKEAREGMVPACDCAQWTKIKKANPWLRFDPKARKNRPRVHRADAARLQRGKLDRKSFELLDVPGLDLPGVADSEITDDYLADAAAVKAQIRAENRGRIARE
jgi:hypothetical protein